MASRLGCTKRATREDDITWAIRIVGSILAANNGKRKIDREAESIISITFLKLRRQIIFYLAIAFM